MTTSIASSRAQALLDVLCRCLYGPLRVTQHGSIWRISGAWKLGTRESTRPDVAGRIMRGDQPAAATCSPLVGLFLDAWLGSPVHHADWGESTRNQALTRAVEAGGCAEYVRPLWSMLGKKRAGLVRWSTIIYRADVLPLVSVARHTVSKPYPSHVVVLLRCGPDLLEVKHPHTGQMLEGLWVLAADGWTEGKKYAWRKGRRRLVCVKYSSGPITLEPAAARNRSLRLADVWGVVDPDPDGRVPGPWQSNVPKMLEVLHA